MAGKARQWYLGNFPEAAIRLKDVMARSVVTSNKLPKLQGRPLSYGVKAGGWVFTAGTVGVNLGGAGWDDGWPPRR